MIGASAASVCEAQPREDPSACSSPAEHPILLTVIWTVVLLAVLAPLGVRRYRGPGRPRIRARPATSTGVGALFFGAAITVLVAITAVRRIITRKTETDSDTPPPGARCLLLTVDAIGNPIAHRGRVWHCPIVGLKMDRLCHTFKVCGQTLESPAGGLRFHLELISAAQCERAY